jgi:hypothetical protein
MKYMAQSGYSDAYGAPRNHRAISRLLGMLGNYDDDDSATSHAGATEAAPPEGRKRKRGEAGASCCYPICKRSRVGAVACPTCKKMFGDSTAMQQHCRSLARRMRCVTTTAELIGRFRPPPPPCRPAWHAAATRQTPSLMRAHRWRQAWQTGCRCGSLAAAEEEASTG